MDKVFKKLEAGVCYYPEHWDKAVWREDLERMLSHGIKTVRVGEFAWNKVEPCEGEFDFSFFEEFLSLCDDVKMKVIFGTPTATPPAWLTEKYPEVLNRRRDGVPFYHGARRHYNYNSPKYRELSSRIVKKIAKAYSSHECIVGWQIDNEINCEVNEFYSKSDSAAFRKYLQNKFGTLEALNEALGTTFWNQTYTDWDEIHVPRNTVGGTINPHFMLEYKRFISFSAISFAQMQADIIKEYRRDEVFITTNGMFSNIDNHAFARDVLDVYCYDSYPNFAYMEGAPKEGMKDREWSRYLSEVRSICPHFGIMEQQSGANGWASGYVAPAPEKGQMSLWAMQSVANGADYISFFRWRTSPMGTEIYWHGLLDYDNRDNEKIAELDLFTSRIKKIGDIAGENVVAGAAVLRDYDNVFDSEVDVWHGKIDRASMQGLFEGAEAVHTPLNYVYISDDTSLSEIEEYKVLFYPHAAIMTEKRAALLNEYVKGGGKLVLSARTGYKDIFGKCPLGRVQPGFLTSLTGADVKEFTFTADKDFSFEMDGKTFAPALLAEKIVPSDSVAVAMYSAGRYKGEAAVTKKEYNGGGACYYVGTDITEEIAEYLLKECSASEPYSDIVAAGKDVELIRRGKYIFALNYTDKNQYVNILFPVRSVDSGRSINGKKKIPPYGVLILQPTE